MLLTKIICLSTSNSCLSTDISDADFTHMYMYNLLTPAI